MRIFNTYILTLSLLLMATTVILAAIGQSSLDVYYTLYTIEALIVTELFVYLNEKARHALNRVALLLFCGFMVIVIQQVVAILT
jgi:hypothetical protein